MKKKGKSEKWTQEREKNAEKKLYYVCIYPLYIFKLFQIYFSLYCII